MAASTWWSRAQYFVDRSLKAFCCRFCHKESAVKVAALFHHVLAQVKRVYTERHELFITREAYTERFSPPSQETISLHVICQ